MSAATPLVRSKRSSPGSSPARLPSSSSTAASSARRAASAAASSSAPAAAASASSSVGFRLVESDTGEVFDIEDFTNATPFERFAASIEEQLHAWRVGVAHPQAADTTHVGAHGDSATVTAAEQSQPVTVPFGSPGTPLQTATLQLAGSNFQLSLYHAAPPFSPSSSPHTRASSASTAASSSLLSLPLRVEHVSCQSGGHHALTAWFGVPSFLLLTPLPDSRGGAVRRVSKNEASTLLSALSVACSAAQCSLPCFVSVEDAARQLYWGRTAYGSVVRFECRVADEVPSHFRHLSGLTDFFHSQREAAEGRAAGSASPAAAPHGTGAGRTQISVSFGFHCETRRWGYADIDPEYTGLDSDEDAYGDESNLECRWRDVAEDQALGFESPTWGPRRDPLQALQLSAAWPFFPEGTFVDNAVYSDLNPSQAPRWTLTPLWRSTEAHTGEDAALLAAQSGVSGSVPLSAALARLIDVCHAGCKLPSVASVLGPAGETPAALGRQEGGLPALLGDAANSLRAHIDDANKIAAHGESLPQEQVDRIMRQLTDVEHSPQAASPRAADTQTAPFAPAQPINPHSTSGFPVSPADPPQSAQLAPYGSLLSRFVSCLLCLASDGVLTVRSVCRLWLELVAELRFHFETGLDLPWLLSSDAPDLGACLLHQKVQMLQRCIRLQRERRNGAEHEQQQSDEQTASAASSSLQQSSQQPSSASRWGALEDLGESPPAGSGGEGWGELDLDLGAATAAGAEDEGEESDEEAALRDAHSRTPLGVLRPLPHLRLLLTGAVMNAPLTQEAPLLTADALDAQQEMLARLGSSAESSRLRTQLQSTHLSAEMAAFKAANPGCCFEDFVRWHSPKDWREAPNAASAVRRKRGELSQRMRKRRPGEQQQHSGGGNVWHDLWQSAAAVPASQQKPLFDAAAEGESVLSYLQHLEPSALFTQLIGVGLQHALCILARTRGVEAALQPVQAAIQRLHHYLRNYSRAIRASELYQEFAACELLCARANTLLLCFPEAQQQSTVTDATAAASIGQATAASSQSASSSASTSPLKEMITQLITIGSFDVPSGILRTQLAAVLSGATARSKAASLFRTRPFNYNAPSANSNAAAGGSNRMESASSNSHGSGTGGCSLPKPDFSEFTFFAPSASAGSGSGASSSLCGTRAYVCLRHSSTPLQPAGSRFNMARLRYCTSLLIHAADE